MTAREIFRRDYGDDADGMMNELTDQVDAIIQDGGCYDDVEELLLDYGLEMDYIFEFI